MVRPDKDITGRRSGLLTAIEFSHRHGSDNFWRCKCDCGGESIVAATRIKRELTKSCGCLSLASGRAKTHGLRSKKNPNYEKIKAAYQRWFAMLQRCTNPKSSGWRYYGARGITVCERWRSFENFYADMGDPPDGFHIDRIDSDKGYAPENCRWISASENSKRAMQKRWRTARSLIEQGVCHA